MPMVDVPDQDQFEPDLAAMPLFKTEGIDTTSAVVVAMSHIDPKGIRNEMDLHARVATAFDEAGLIYKHECVLSCGERIDFLCAGGVGLELKWRAWRAPAVWEQLRRYAASPSVRRLILGAGGCSRHEKLTIGGKPLLIVPATATIETKGV